MQVDNSKHMITIKSIVENTYTNEEGLKLYLALKPLFEKGEKVEVSFKELTPTSSSFLNSSVGALIEEFGLSKVNLLLKPKEITRSHADFLRKYIESFSELERN